MTARIKSSLWDIATERNRLSSLFLCRRAAGREIRFFQKNPICFAKPCVQEDKNKLKFLTELDILSEN
jgi:hypothetical protein